MASADLIVVSTDGASFSDVEGYMQHVSELRRSRIAKKRCDGDKLSALAAGLLVSMELSRRSGIPGSRLRYSHGAFGKPYLKGAEVYFSLSHTNGAVCAAFSDAEIGADIERRDRRVGERLYSRVLSDGERPQVHSAEDFIRLWVQKEAFLKRLGTGIADDLRGADTTIMRDTMALECGEYLVGVSGADSVELRVMTLGELLAEFDREKATVGNI